MIRQGMIAVVGILAALAFVGAHPALAKDAPPAVRDDAQMFDAATRDRVDKIAQDIQKRFGRDLIVQTFPSIPEDMQAAFAAQKKEVFYENWLRREARAAKASGVYILIVKNPGHLQVGVGSKTSQSLFTVSDRDELRDMMIARFGDKKFDDGLVDAADFVASRMAKNTGGKNAPIDNEPDPVAAPQQPSTPQTPTTSAVKSPTTTPATQPAKDSPASSTANK